MNDSDLIRALYSREPKAVAWVCVVPKCKKKIHSEARPKCPQHKISMEEK